MSYKFKINKDLSLQNVNKVSLTVDFKLNGNDGFFSFFVQMPIVIVKYCTYHLVQGWGTSGPLAV